jgi:hypothetical protein
MKKCNHLALVLALPVMLIGIALPLLSQTGAGAQAPTQRPEGPCDIYAAAGVPCVAAHSTTRALYSSYNGPLYQVLRQSDGKTLDIGVVQPVAKPWQDAGGYADAAAQDAFCANTYCWISAIYDQSGNHNHLTQAPRGGFSGPALGGFNNLPLAGMAPITILGHKAYGVFIEPGMGLRKDDAKGTAVDDQAEGEYWVINGHHFNSGCCFDYGNAEIDSRDDDNGTMETAYFGDAPWWIHGNPPGPWVMTDQENNLVGCANPDKSNLCPSLPNIPWRFVTAIAKGEPHRWESMGGDAQQGALRVMADGQRVNGTYDPMRKQGAILLGNGGDNSNGSQGTFYEGALTAAGTIPPDAVDQMVQENIVAAGYAVPQLSVAPASALAAPPGLQTFSPGSSQDTVVTFTNAAKEPVKDIRLSLGLPGAQWSASVAGGSGKAKTFAEPVAPGASVSATFKITSGQAPFNGDLVATASWDNTATGLKQQEQATEKLRSTSPVKINEFRISSASPTNPTNSFIELYNAGTASVDLSNWTLSEHPTQQAIFSAAKIPAGTHLASHGFYLLGLSNSGLAVEAHAGDAAVFLRSTAAMSAGDTILLGTGPAAETRKITALGTAASNHTTLWQPLPEGPVMTIPAGATNVPVDSTSGFVVGEKIALGYGATYPSVAREVERYEVATVTAVGKPGTQAYLAEDAPAGSANIKVTSVAAISVGDQIRLDIDSRGHGIETVTVTHVGTKASQTNLAADAPAGASHIRLRSADGFAVGDTVTVGTPASREVVTVASVHSAPRGAGIDFTPALARAHIRDEWVVSPGTGLDLAASLKFNHAANLPFSNRGTGISFTPATAFAHSSNEPIQALGTGIQLDSPLAQDHEIQAPVRDVAVTSAGYQGSPEPNQWFGGPEFTTSAPLFGRMITVKEGSMVLRDASGLVVDSLNYGGLVDPWAAEGYQGISGIEKSGCFAPAPGAGAGGDPFASAAVVTASAGRFPDGADSDSNCADFATQATSTMAISSAAGATNIKVTGVAGFSGGQKILMDAGNDQETAVIATVGTAGATQLHAATDAGASVISVAGLAGFREGETITIGNGASSESAIIASINWWGGASITVTTQLKHAHAEGDQVSGSGITLAAPTSRAHASGAQVTDTLPTPGATNRYFKKPH